MLKHWAQAPRWRLVLKTRVEHELDMLERISQVWWAGAQDNWPEMGVTCLDLSPYYLHEARANLRRWARLRAPGLAMGGVDGNGAAFLQAAAENIPQPDGSFDVVRARLRADLCRWHC